MQGKSSLGKDPAYKIKDEETTHETHLSKMADDGLDHLFNGYLP